MAEQVGAVGGNLELENRIGPHKVAHGSADFIVGGQNPQAVLLVGQTQLRGRAEHAAALYTAQLAVLNLPAAGQYSTGQGAGYLVAYLVVLCTADNLAQGALAGVDHADIEVVAALDGCFLHHLSYYHQIGGHTALLYTLYLNTGEGEHVGHLLCAQTLQVDVACKPVK